MVTSDQLLPLITQLQRGGTIPQGRRQLLKYIRKRSGAQLAVLFVLDKDLQCLTLLAYSGRRPPYPDRPAPSSQHQDAEAGARRAAMKRIPVDGLFGSALLTYGLLHIPDLDSDQRILQEERSWAWPGGSAILSAVHTGSQSLGEQGVLVLCFDTRADSISRLTRRSNARTAEREDDLRICIALLASYLSDKDHSASPSLPLLRRLVPTGIGHDEQEKQGIADLLSPQHVQQCTFPEMMYSLSCLSELYEIGLLAGIDTETDELYQHVLTHMRRVIRARGACLLLYQPAQQRFIPVASQGDELPRSTLTASIENLAIERLAMRGPGETLTLLDDQRVLLVSLSCNCVLIGVVALSIDEDALLDERALLLTYLGNVAALVLRNYNMRVVEQQAAIGMERSRIARDIHDGALQRIAHVMYKLEFIERMLEKQQSPHILSEVQQVATLLRESLQDLRHNISSLLPMQLEKQEFTIALQALLDEYKVNDQGVEIYCDFDDLRQVPTRLQGTIFRFVQEALNNVYKHARATRVSIGIHMLADWLSAEVSDNGVGFQAQRVMSRSGARRNTVATVSHIGLHSMRGRVREAGGNLEVRSRPGEGTIVRVRFPLLNSDEANSNSSL